MNATERALACLNYEKYDRLPRVHFGWWPETLAIWKEQGHIADADREDNGVALARRLGQAVAVAGDPHPPPQEGAQRFADVVDVDP